MHTFLVLVFALVVSSQFGAAQNMRPPVRDVLATAFDYPFLTDAEVETHWSDTRGRIITHGGPVFIRAPRLGSVLVDGAPQKTQRFGPDLVRVELAPGTHEIAINTADSNAPLNAPPAGDALSTSEEINARTAQLKPGDELVLRDGVYANWRWDVKAEGTAQQPIVIRPQTPGGVIFQRDSRLVLRGRFVIFKGFRFEQCGPEAALHLAESSDCRVTQCQFFRCGNATSTFGNVLRVDMGCHRNRVDHCYFTGSKSMSLTQRISAVSEVGTGNRFDHNLFRDIYRYWVNGQENIQIGQNQRDPTGQAHPSCTVENNVFDHAWGDGEIISNKSTGNLIRWNLAAHCKRSAFTLRGGDEVRFDGNVMLDNGDGLRVMGRRHTIINNMILDQPGWGILFETGSKDGQMQVAGDYTLVAHNTIVNCATGAIGGMAPSEGRPHQASGVIFVNNLLTGLTGTLLDLTHFVNPTPRRNLLWPTQSAQSGTSGAEAVVADPLLQGEGLTLRPATRSPVVNAGERLDAAAHDRWNRSRGERPDLGADEMGATRESVVLPPVPPRPLLNPSLFMQRSLFMPNPARPADAWQTTSGATVEKDALILRDASARFKQPLPGDFVLVWEHQAESFASVARLQLPSGYSLSWGGAAPDGKPAGVITLRKNDGKGDEIVADGADYLQYFQDFRYQAWMDTTRNTRTAPDPQLWYRFTFIKRGGRLILLLSDARRRHDLLPVLIWEDRNAASPPSQTEGQSLRIEQQGSGHWRSFELSSYSYVGDALPSPPQNLEATAFGGGRVSLRWTASQPAMTFDVFRATAGEANEKSIASGVRQGFDDFEVAPNAHYVYSVRAVNPFGTTSPFASVTATSGTGGPFYRLIPASAARLETPLALSTDGSKSFLWAPPGTPSAMTEPAAQGGAALRFTVERDGDYTLWGLVRTPDEGSDSFFTALDNAPFKIWYTGLHATWEWSKITGPQYLTAGEHTLRLNQREAGAALSVLLVTNDLTFAS